MNLVRINTALGIILLVAISLVFAVNVDHTQLNVEFIPEMVRSPAKDAFAANSNFSNGRTLQAPVPGTIARGDLPLYFAATKEDAVRAGEEILNPYTVNQPEAAEPEVKEEPPSAPASEDTAPDEKAEANESTPPEQPDPLAKLNASIDRGANVYGVFCVSCHGGSGAGDGPVAKHGFPPPPVLATGKSVKMKDGQLFHILTYGQGSMPSMAAQLTRDRRWDAVNYVRSLQTGNAEAQPEDTAAPKEEAEEAAAKENASSPKTTDESTKSEENPQ